MPTPALPTPAAGATTARRLLVLDDILAPDRNSFGAIRLAMAIAVLLSHSFLFHGGTRSADPLLAWTGHTLGEHAVQVFFFLSGILIAQSFDKSRSLLQVAAARALRILPALIVVVLLTAFVLGPLLTPLTLGAYLTDGRLPAYVLKTIGLVTGAAPLPGLFEALPLAGRVNMSLWTLKYEVICYLGVALLGLAGLFRVRWRVPAILLLALAVATVFIGPPKVQETQTFLETTRYFALYFFMGTLAYLVRRWLAIKPLLLLPLALLFAAAIGTRFHELAGALLIGYGTVVLASRSWGFLTPFADEIIHNRDVRIGELAEVGLRLPDEGGVAAHEQAVAVTLDEERFAGLEAQCAAGGHGDDEPAVLAEGRAISRSVFGHGCFLCC